MSPRLPLAWSMTFAIAELLAASWSIRPIAVDCSRFSTIFMALAVSSARSEMALSVSPVRSVMALMSAAFSARSRSALSCVRAAIRSAASLPVAAYCSMTGRACSSMSRDSSIERPASIELSSRVLSSSTLRIDWPRASSAFSASLRLC